jgi:16S rRNA (uracil1498-N3)-methyltransferase
MNLILLQDEDFLSPCEVRLYGRRLQHVRTVHRAAIGDRLRVGRIDGPLGSGTISALDDEQLVMEVVLDQPPPPPLPVSLLLALPRPKMLKRILQAIAALGVKRLYLLNSTRVEKSFWGSPLLEPERLQEQLLLGLEQAGDTILPEVRLRPRFKPFVEDELPQLVAGSRAYVAHPVAAADCPQISSGPVTLAIGPEGGFIPYEVEKLQQAGFTPVSLGPRVLRVETAVPVLLSRFAPH